MRRWKDKKFENLDIKKLWKNGATYLVLFLAVGAMTFFGVCDPSSNRNILPGGNAAQIADQEISSADFKRAYRNIYNRYQTQLKERFDAKSLQLSKRVMDQLVKDYVVYTEALRSGVSAKDFEVTELILGVQAFKDKDGHFDSSLLNNYLRNMGYTEKSFEDEIRRDIATRKLRDFLSETTLESDNAIKLRYRLSETKLNIDYLKIEKSKVKVEISQEDLKKYLEDEKNKTTVEQYYKTHKSEFNTPKKVHAFHILSSYKGARNASGSATKRGREEAEKRAQSILKEVKSGSNFKNLAEKKSDEPTAKTKGGDLGFFTFEDMVPEFSEVAFKLKKGEVSGVVNTPFGFHIIKIVDIKEAKETSLDEAKEQIARKNLKKEKLPLLVTQTAQKILKKVKENPSYKPADFEWESTDEFAMDTRYIPGIGSEDATKKAILSLHKKGQVYKESVVVAGNHFILKLKSLQPADLEALTAEKIAKMKENNRLIEGYTTFASLNKILQDHYRKNGLVSINAEFSDLDIQETVPGS